MKNQQLYSRLAPEAVERVIRRFNDRELTMQEAMAALSVSRAQVYNLRTQWLAAGKKASFLGASGGDRKSAWPTACVEELKTLIEASKDDGPNFELYADELARKHEFVRDRSSVRKFCEKNLMTLMRSTFPVERKKPDAPLSSLGGRVLRRDLPARLDATTHLGSRRREPEHHPLA